MSNTTSSDSAPASFAGNPAPSETFSPDPAPTFFDRFNRSRVVTVAIFAVVAAAFFLMVHWTPLVYDDFGYSTVRDSNPAERISDLSGLLYSSVDHYFEQNGRFANAPLCMILEWIGKPATNFITTVAFLALIVAVYKLVRIKNLRNSVFLALFGLAYLLVPAFDESCLWLCGSANYLWAALIVLWFLVCHQKIDAGWAPRKFQCVGIAVLALIAGWMHEGVSLGVCFGLFFYYVFHREKITKEKLICFLPFFVGTAIVVFAPGTLHRGEIVSGGFSAIDFALKFARGCVILVFRSPTALMLVLSLLLAFVFRRERAVHFAKANSLLLLTVLGSIPLLAVFGNSGRATFGFFFFTTICLFRFFEPEIFKFKKTFATLAVLAFVGATALFATLAPEYRRVYDATLRFYDDVRKTETGVVVADEIEPIHSSYVLGLKYSSFLDTNDWPARGLARYFNAGKKIVVIPRDLYTLIFAEDKFFAPGAEYEWKRVPNHNFFIRKARAGERVEGRVAKIFCEVNRAEMTPFYEVLIWGVTATKIRQVEGWVDALKTESGACVFEWELPSGRYFLVTAADFRIVPVITTKVVDSVGSTE